MFPVTADSGECLPRQTMRLCSSGPLPTPCLCVRIGNISPPLPPRETHRERERERERERRNHRHPARPKFIPAVPDPADRFLPSSRNVARSIARARGLADRSSRQILARPFCVARLSETRCVPGVAAEQSADIPSYGFGSRLSREMAHISRALRRQSRDIKVRRAGLIDTLLTRRSNYR